MEQLEFDCRLESERELEENVNIALEFACKQVKETSKLRRRHIHRRLPEARLRMPDKRRIHQKDGIRQPASGIRAPD